MQIEFEFKIYFKIHILDKNENKIFKATWKQLES